ncbi:MAG: cupin-like domain-containing protein, partial [Rhodanobacteraceae bacterium]
TQQPGPYPCKYEIAKNFRELLPEVSPRFRHSLPDRQANRLIPQHLFSDVNNLEIFFGGPGGQFPYIHYDVFHLHAWITQLHGDKEFTLYAPNQEPRLYVDPETPWQSGIKNHHRPDYERYPLFRQAKSQKVVIHAGETLFLPCGWWHTARSLNLTISVAFDQLGIDNWADFIADVGDAQRRLGRRGKAMMLGLYLRALGPLLRLGERVGVDQSRQWGRR